jgi:peptidyl-prolyl cis-trans isomerase C
MKSFISVSVLALAMVIFSGLGSIGDVAAQTKKAVSKETQEDKKVLVRVGTKTMTKADLEARIAALPPQYQEALKGAQARRNFLDVYVQAQLFAYGAKEEKIDKEPAVAAQIDDQVSGLLAQAFVSRKLSKAGPVTQEDIKKYYEENKAQLVNPTTAKVQHILIKLEDGAKPEEAAAALAKAEMIKKALNGGADFNTLAKEHSDDTETKENGGDLGYFSQQQMVPEFSEPVFKMKTGDISSPIKSPFGYHVVKVNDRKEGKTMDLAEATPVIESTLMKMKQQKILEAEFERLKKKYKVVIADELD